MSHDTVFRRVDRAAFAAALSSRLRDAGLQLPLNATERFADALAAVRPNTRDRMYWTARTCLVDDVSQHETFDRVFAVVFGGDSSLSPVDRRVPVDAPREDAPEDAAHRRLRGEPARQAGGGGVPWTTLPSATEPDAGLDAGLALPELLPSELAVLADVPFDALDEDELRAVGVCLEAVVHEWPRRRARRLRGSSRGRSIDRRRTLRAAMRTGGEPVSLRFSERRRRPRRVVMLADVSGSMQTYARAYLHLMRALGQVAEAETFAFATRLTRLTPTLLHRDPRVAIERATAEVEDRFSGTRIAGSLRELLRSSTWSTFVRGAVVVIASDGWDTDPPEELEARMRRLQRMAHRIVWVNPRMAADRFEPSTGGMAASLPHCDAFVSGHSLAAMDELFAAMVGHRTSRPTGAPLPPSGTRGRG